MTIQVSEGAAFADSGHLLFVYGTLKSGDCRHHYLLDAPRLGTIKTGPHYRLYNCGTYPALVPCSNGYAVEGELYSVSENDLERLDVVEGVEEGLYHREVIDLDHSSASTSISALGHAVPIAYIYLQSVSEFAECGPCWHPLSKSSSQQKPLPCLSRAQSQRVDQIAIQKFGMSGLQLMETAGNGTVTQLMRRISDSSQCHIHLLCGKGNNGGDGYVIARVLHQRGYLVSVWELGKTNELSHDAQFNRSRCVDHQVPMQQAELSTVAEVLAACNDRDWIVDSMLGTGVTTKPRAPYPQLIEMINRSSANVLAVDLPTGLDADTGLPFEEAVRADLTCTFVTQKLGFRHPRARDYLGEVVVIDLNLPEAILEIVQNETP